MINKDYILRVAERIGRELSILLGLREFNRHEEALISIDDLLLKTVGMTSRFINSISEEMLVKALSPLGKLNIEAILWCAALLKAEGEIYEDQHNTTESYYRYLKSLYLYLTALIYEAIAPDSTLYLEAETLIKKLDDYELPTNLKLLLFSYYELLGKYALAEDTLFELLEAETPTPELLSKGTAFYQRLLAKSDHDLHAGNFSREEIQDGQAHLQALESQNS